MPHQTIAPCLGLGCPWCQKNLLVRSDDPDIYFVCPNPECGYVIWASYPKLKPIPSTDAD